MSPLHNSCSNFNIHAELYYITCCQHFELERQQFGLERQHVAKIQKSTLQLAVDQLTRTPFK